MQEETSKPTSWQPWPKAITFSLAAGSSACQAACRQCVGVTATVLCAGDRTCKPYICAHSSGRESITLCIQELTILRSSSTLGSCQYSVTSGCLFMKPEEHSRHLKDTSTAITRTIKIISILQISFITFVS